MLRITSLYSVTIVLLTACCICKTTGSDSYAVLYASAENTHNTALFCMTYDQGYHRLPTRREDAEAMPFTDLTLPKYKMFCDPSVDIPAVVNGSAVAVQRGNCTFSDKARMAQDHGVHAVMIVSQSLSKMVANTSSDYMDINITVAMITVDTFRHLQSLGDNVLVTLYAPAPSRTDLNLLVIWLLAMITVTVGSLWSGVVKYHLWLSKISPTSSESSNVDRRRGSEVELSPRVVVISVILMCLILLGLYFFYEYLVYIIIALFVLAASLALHECVTALFHLLPISDRYKCRLPASQLPCLRRRPYVIDVIFLFLCLAVGVCWFVIRHYSYAWILQDFLGVVFCVQMMKTIRLPHLKSCAVLLVLLFLYDIFFVFITPLFTKDGQSVMIEVATGGKSGSDESLPLVLLIPRLLKSDVSVCLLPYSLLGFGDVLIPGLLVSFCCGFGFQVKARYIIYLVSTVVAYGFGLLVTFGALAIMGSGQPALLYIVPLTLGTTVLVGWRRKELRQLWTGQPLCMDTESTRPVPVSVSDAAVTVGDQQDAGADSPASTDDEQQRLVNT